MPINLLARQRESLQQPINLLRRNQPQEQETIGSFEDLTSEDQAKVMELTKQKIAEQHPNLPDWMRDLMLKITPKDKSPTLDAASKGITDVTNYIPAAAGGLLQGASIPIRGVASLIPTEFTQNLANSPDLRDLFPKSEGMGQKSVQMAAELAGGGGLFGKLMQGVKGASALARVPKALQSPLALGGAGYLATPGNQTDKALGAAGALALGGAGNLAGKAAGKVGEKIPSFLRGLSSKSTNEDLIQSVLKPHDRLQSTADELYGQVRKAIKKRDIKPQVNPKYLDEIMEYPSMQSKTHKELIQKAKEGDYEALHKIQSSLYKKGTKDTLNPDSVIETRGENILEIRDKINEDLERSLLKEGHIDVAHVLKQGKKAVAQLKSTYFNKHLPKSIGKLVHSETRLIPKEPRKMFDQKSSPMDEFLAKHPDTAKHAKGIREKEDAIKMLNSLFTKGGIAGGLTFGGNSLYDLLK
jgi:hypothetical protein